MKGPAQPRGLLILALLALLALVAIDAPAAATIPRCGPGSHVVLAAPPKGFAYAAAFPFFSSARHNEDAVLQPRLDAFERLAGRPLAWGYFSNHWLGGRIRFPSKAVATIWSHGSFPFVRMMPWSRQTENEPDPIFSLNDLAAGRWDRQLGVWADEARRSGIPLMVDFGPEMNGDWFPWSARFAGGETTGAHAYRAAYRHIVTLFRRHAAANVSFAFHVDAGVGSSVERRSVEEYYPGNSYIDWVGASVYGADAPQYPWTSFAEGFAAAYRALRVLAPAKPLAVFEWGVVEGSTGAEKAGWIDAAWTALETRFAAVRAVSWWDERWQNDDGSWSDTRVNSSPQSLAAYRRGIGARRYGARIGFACAPGR